MTRYVALLRGVNVGGKNMLSMPALRAALEGCGFEDVRTYINSGNILFSSDVPEEQALREGMETLLRERFSVQTPVMVLSAAALSDALAQAPAWWGADKESKHNAIFVIPPLTAEAAFRAAGDLKPAYERAAYAGQVIFWSAPLKTFSRTRWSKVGGTPLYDSVTIRSANTARKLLALAWEDAGR